MRTEQPTGEVEEYYSRVEDPRDLWIDSSTVFHKAKKEGRLLRPCWEG
jgi:hypothetical protein